MARSLAAVDSMSAKDNGVGPRFGSIVFGHYSGSSEVAGRPSEVGPKVNALCAGEEVFPVPSADGATFEVDGGD